MPKYVCDFEEVHSIGDKICHVAENIGSSVDTYSSHIDSDLSSWSGSAKNAFKDTNNDQINLAKKDVEYINSLGEFLKFSSEKIQSLEEDLANLNI